MSSDDNNHSKKVNKTRTVVLSVFIDLIIAGLLLTIFVYFQHVRHMRVDDGGIITTDRPKGNEDTKKETGTDSEDSPDDTDIVDYGDFGESFPDVFAPAGTVESDENHYKSEDISITITENYSEYEDYVAKYYVFDVYIRNIENLYTVASTSRRPFTELVENSGAVAVVSGDYWKTNAKVAVRNSDWILDAEHIDGDICVLYENGVMEIISPYEYDPEYFKDPATGVYQIWDFGPTLVEDGKAVTDFRDHSDISGRNPRSAIGYIEPGHYILIVAEGRCDITYKGEKVYSKGIRLVDFARIFEELGCKVAYNLDGGDSAYAYYDGVILRQDYERANTPGQAPREIYDIICIGEVE